MNYFIKKYWVLVMIVLLTECSENTGPKEVSKDIKMDLSDITKNLAGSKASMEEKYAFVKGNVIIILAEALNKDSSNLKVQDFTDDKGSFIPVFTSQEKLKESTKGTKLGKGTLEINALFMLSIMHNTDRIRLDPGLKSEAYFDVSELEEKYKHELDSLKRRMIPGK